MTEQNEKVIKIKTISMEEVVEKTQKDITVPNISDTDSQISIDNVNKEKKNICCASFCAYYSVDNNSVFRKAELRGFQSGKGKSYQDRADCRLYVKFNNHSFARIPCRQQRATSEYQG